MINVVDRVSTYPGRVKLTRADGSVEYVTWERADEPTVPGTPINKALFESIKADIGLAANTTLYVSKSGSDTLGNGSSSNPYLTIMKALNSLPKNLNGFNATISIAAGTYLEHVAVHNFFGGIIILSGASGAAVSINSLNVAFGSYVQIENITLSVISSNDNNAINVTSASLLGLTAIRCTGATTTGLIANRNGFVHMGDLTVSNTTAYAITSVNASRIWVYNVQGTNNTGVGLNAEGGSILAYGIRSMASTTASTTSGGGRIYTGS